MSLKLYLRPNPHTECILWERNESLADLERLLPRDITAAVLQEHATEFRRKEKLGTIWALEQQWQLGRQLQKKENGAPVLIDDSRNISLSHSKQYIAIGLSTLPIGIDVEELSRPIEHLATRYLHPDEFEIFHTNRLKTLAWSIKEAVYKCIQQEGVDFRNDIRINKLTHLKSDDLNIFPKEDIEAYTTNTVVDFKNRKYSLTLVCLLYAQQSYAISWLSDIN